jgi:hypothetical protein
MRYCARDERIGPSAPLCGEGFQDVEKFFDSVPWDLVVKAVEAHSAERWVVLYVKR